MIGYSRVAVYAVVAAFFAITPLQAQTIEVEGQPLAGNATRLLKALDSLGNPLAAEHVRAIEDAATKQDAAALQQLLDKHVLVHIHLNPEARVKVKQGPGPAMLQQGGYTPVLLKIHNESTVTKPLKVASPQALPVYSGGRAKFKADKLTDDDIKNRFLDVDLHTSPPMTDKLSGLKVEYAILLIHSTQAGKREATLVFDLGPGTADLGSRAEVPILFDIKPAIPVKLVIDDFDDTPTTGRFTFKDKLGRVYPPKAKRLAPDFFFQDQVYRHSGGVVLLPPGELTMTYGRGPEYRLITKKIIVPEKGGTTVKVKMERWINAMNFGFYSGDHHIHAAGCSHYTNPTEGVFAEDMFLHVKGEGLNVGCNLTWGPCFEFQRQFFEPNANKVSEPFTVLKYDIEVSGFGSQALGHVCLLNLRDQTYPGSNGTKTEGWPTWTTPLMRWAKNQGAYTGYAHSASGLGVNPKEAAKRLVDALDANKDGKVSMEEAKGHLLPDAFENIDTNSDGLLTADELTFAISRVAGHIRGIPAQLPNLAIPEMDGIGAQEICVTTAQGLCDFISAMDTNRVPEWNCWYHILNCGFPLKVSGETDFPCITDSRVGQGRVYVQLGKIDKIDFKAWAEGLAKGRSYVSDGYAHALHFSVNDKVPGGRVELSKAGNVAVKAKVAFAAESPLGTAQGGQLPKGNKRLVELIVNGRVVASQEVTADDKEHDLAFQIEIDKSSWVALRHFPQMHTNPVEVIVEQKPIRASRQSAMWCVGVIEQLWKVRGPGIKESERADAERVFQWAILRYQKIAEEAAPGEPLAWKVNPNELASLFEAAVKEKESMTALAFADAIASLGSQVRENVAIIRTLQSALNDKRNEVRQAAYAALMSVDPALKHSPKLVKRTLGEKDAKWPLAFLKGVREDGEPLPHTVAAIRDGLDHPSGEVRLETVRLLFAYGSAFRKDKAAFSQAAEVLEGILKDKKLASPGAITLAAEFGAQGKRLLPALQAIVKADDPKTRFEAIRAIALIDPSLVPALSNAPLHYLPDDAAVVSQVNVEALTDVEFVRKAFMPDIQRDLKKLKVLSAMNVDPVRDVMSITTTSERFGSGKDLPVKIQFFSEPNDGLTVLLGDFPKAPLFKLFEQVESGKTTYAMAVTGKVILVSTRKETVEAAQRRAFEGRAKLPPQFAVPFKKVDTSATVWQIIVPPETGIDAYLSALSVESKSVLTLTFFVANEEAAKELTPIAKIMSQTLGEKFRETLEKARVEPAGIRASTAAGIDYVQVRVELPQLIVEMLLRENWRKN